MSQVSTSRDLIRNALPLPSTSLNQTALPAWLMHLPGVQTVVDRMGATELRRRLFHMTPAFIPIGLPWIPHNAVWGPILNSLIVVFAIAALILAFVFGPLLTRRNEKSWMRAVLGYMAPVLTPLLLLPGHAELGLMTLQIVALGDGSATFGGKMLGGWRLPWNRDKTFSGLICFTLIGSIAATYSFWGEIRPTVSIGTAYLICGTAALCAALIESLPIRSNDNLRVGTTALLVGMAMSAWVL